MSKYQEMQDRFQSNHLIRRCYYFEVDALKQLFVDAGFEAIECKYVQRQTVNKKEDVSVPRVFVQGQFLKR